MALAVDVLASAQWNPKALIPVVLGLLLMKFSNRMGTDAAGVSEPWRRLAGPKHRDRLARAASSRGRAEGESAIVALGGFMFVIVGLGLFFGILPSN